MEGNHGTSLSEGAWANEDIAKTEKTLSDAFLSGSFEPNTTFKEYVGPLRIHDTGTSRGRGLIIQKNARCGQILIISNSIASVTTDWPLVGETNEELLGKVASGLVTWSSSSKIKCDQVKQLSYSEDSSGIGVPPISLYAREVSVGDEDSDPGKLQGYEHMRRVAQHNAIHHQTNTRNSNIVSGIFEKDKFITWGIWLLPSFINHSCIPNCNRMFIGKTMIIRAACDVYKGEEITLPYFSIFDRLGQRKLAARKRKFACDCQRCTFEHSAKEKFHDIEKGLEDIARQFQKLTEVSPSLRLRELVRMRPIFGESLHSHPIALRLQEKQCQYIPLIERTIKQFASEKKISTTDVRLKWIKASYADTYIAGFLHTTSRIHTTTEMLLDILDVVDVIHPGNRYGIHFFSNFLRFIKRPKTSDYYRHKEDEAKKFYTAFYGKQQNKVFQALLARNSWPRRDWISRWLNCRLKNLTNIVGRNRP